MSNEEKWQLMWNHDVQFGFTCGAFAGVLGLVIVCFQNRSFWRSLFGER